MKSIVFLLALYFVAQASSKAVPTHNQEIGSSDSDLARDKRGCGELVHFTLGKRFLTILHQVAVPMDVSALLRKMRYSKMDRFKSTKQKERNAVAVSSQTIKDSMVLIECSQ
jgi:Zn-finger domain-containing protein